MKTERYRLYVGVMGKENIQTALNEAYSRATKTHILIYKKGKCPDGFKEMREEDTYLLPASDIQWLKEVNMTLMQEFLKKNQAKEERAERKFLDEFEKELQIEREKLAKQESGDAQ